MQLVELDNINQPINNYQHNSIPINDETYSKPYVLSALDQLMDGILRKSGISDGDKWQLYNQSLQKYLNFVKLQSKKPQNLQNLQNPSESYRNLSKVDSAFCVPNDLSFNISGIEPLRDSLDSISVPIVRNFFEKIRENDGNFNNNYMMSSSSSLSKNEEIAQSQASTSESPKNKKSNRKRSLTYHDFSPVKTRSKARSKATTKRHADSALSGIRPCKVILHNIAWDPTTAQ